MNSTQYKAFKGAEEYARLVRTKQAKKDEKLKELNERRNRLPIDYQYMGTSDEESQSDYDVKDSELYPKRNRVVPE